MTSREEESVSRESREAVPACPPKVSSEAETAADDVGPKVSPVPGGLVFRILDTFPETVVMIALLGELGVVLANVLARICFHKSFLWADEVARLALSTLAFVGGAVAYRRREHAFVRVVVNLFPARVQRVCFALADVLALFIVGVTGVASIEFIESSWSERTPIFQMPAATIALPLTLGLALLALHAVDHLRREHGVRAWKVGGAVALGIAVADGDPPGLAAVVHRRYRHPRHLGPLLPRDPRRRARGIRPAARNGELSLDYRCRVFGGPPAEHGEWHRQLHPPGGPLLHFCRTDHGAGCHQRSSGPLCLHARGPPAGRPPAGHGGQHVHRLRPVRLQAGGCGRRRHGDEGRAARAPRRGRGRGRAGRLGGHGRDRAAQHRHADRGVDHQPVGGGALHRGLHPGGGDGRVPHGAHLRAGPPRRNAAGRARPGRVRCSRRRSPRCRRS